MFKRLLFLSTFILFNATARAQQDNWTLTTADFARQPVALTGIDGANVTFTHQGKPAGPVPLERVLRLDCEGRAPSTPSHYTLFLSNGDRLTGDPGDLKDDTLTWSSPVLGQRKFPVDALRAIGRQPNPTGLDDERKEDQVTLSNKDVVRGVVAGLEDGKVLVQVNGGDTSPVPLASADTILFATAGGHANAKAGPAPRQFRVRFVDGSVFTVPSLRVADGKVDLTPGAEGGSKSTPIDLANVLSIEQVNGPVSWLSDHVPTINEQVPFNSEATYPAKMDRNVFGRPLRVGAQTFEKGIGVHANSRVAFALDGSYPYFRTRYAVDTTGDAGKADVNVRVLLDGKVVHEQKHVRAFQPMPVIKLELGAAKTLELEVTAAGPTDTQDRVDWVEAALVRELPVAPATTATEPAAPPAPAE